MPASLRADIEARVKNLLITRLDVSADVLAEAGSETLLLGQGIGLDSVEAMGLASDVESAFNIRFEDEELTTELVSSIGTLAAAVEDKLRQADKTTTT